MRKSKKGVYKLKNPDKFIPPKDKFMGSYKDGYVLYKSKLEFRSFLYCDLNPVVKKWSLECISIPYIKPTDCKVHRYYPDLYIEFEHKKFLVEIKPWCETQPPKKSKNYQAKLTTYAINQAKFQACSEYCLNNNLGFVILTEKDLGS